MPYNVPIPQTAQIANPIAQQVAGHLQAPAIAAGDVISTADIVRAHEEEQFKASLRDAGLVNSQELGEAKARTHAVTSANVAEMFPAAGAPAWFIPAVQAAVQAAIEPINNRLIAMDRRMSQYWNSSAGDGLTKPWQLVAFVNGQNPTVAPHNLPAVTDVNALNGLTAQQITAYLIGYGAQIPHLVVDRRRELGKMLGYYGP
jgi:hypothetical protein